MTPGGWPKADHSCECNAPLERFDLGQDPLKSVSIQVLSISLLGEGHGEHPPSCFGRKTVANRHESSQLYFGVSDSARPSSAHARPAFFPHRQRLLGRLVGGFLPHVTTVTICWLLMEGIFSSEPPIGRCYDLPGSPSNFTFHPQR